MFWRRVQNTLILRVSDLLTRLRFHLSRGVDVDVDIKQCSFWFDHGPILVLDLFDWFYCGEWLVRTLLESLLLTRSALSATFLSFSDYLELFQIKFAFITIFGVLNL